MTIIDDRTANLNLALPNKDNALEDDAARLRSALTAIDTAWLMKADLVGGKVPAIQLPSYVDDVVEAANFASLPTTGETGKIYVTLDDNKTFRWSGSSYVNITASPGSTDAVPEGATNKYFTDARAIAAIPVATGLVAGKVKAGAGLTVGGDGTLAVVGGGGSGLPVFDELVIVPSTNGQVTLTPSGGYTAGQIELYLNGVLLYGNADDYTATNGTTIVLTVGANTTDTFLLRRWTYLPSSLALNKAGDTMTGSLGLVGNATAALEAVPKKQLDSSVATLLPKSGGTLTGALTLSGDATSALHPVTKQQLESFVSDASTTVKGKVQLSTPSEAQTGTDPNKAVTCAGLGSTVPGIGQTRVDVTASRAFGITYYNTSGRLRKVMICFSTNNSVTPTRLIVGGKIHDQACGSGAGVYQYSIQADVLPGESYVAQGGVPTLIVWTEIQ